MLARLRWANCLLDFIIELAPKNRIFEMVGKVAKFYYGSMDSVQLLSLIRKVESSGLLLSPQNFIWFLLKLSKSLKLLESYVS